MMATQKKVKLFFNMKPVKYDLGYQKKTKPIIRPVTVKPRLNLKEEHLKKILEGVEYDLVISNIDFPADTRARWLKACFDPDNTAHKLAKAVYTQTMNMIFTDLFSYIEASKEYKETLKLKYMAKRYRGVVNAKDFNPPDTTT